MSLARLLLPGQLPDGTLLPWSRIAGVTGYPSAVDGYTPWAELVELRPGYDTRMIPSAAAGWVDAATGRALVRGLGHFKDAAWTWCPTAPWNQDRLCATVGPGDARVTARLDELVHRWGSAGFSGRAWAPQEEVVIEAPRYADSLILTAERSVLEALMREGLEIHPVSRARDIPIWCD